MMHGLFTGAGCVLKLNQEIEDVNNSTTHIVLDEL
jgi:hypothetical protein